ncbi:MAG: UDP-glucose/GDP-mannose dehydrogenase family protein [Alphaproteobacteria bacterium]|nr:UDP-glucose/GDP-mannose dehydrogenase family protein [Alphaproteobacteria bacterium]
MIITVCGIGYSGLMVSLFLCELGHIVNCFDNNPSVLAELKKEDNSLYINEPGIKNLVSNYVKSNKLNLFNNISDAVNNTDAIIIKIPIKGNLSSLEDVDLTPFNKLVSNVIPYLNRNKYIPIFISTTVPIGTCSLVADNIQHIRTDLTITKHYDIICAPVFLREGSALHDLMKPDRLIFGLKQESDLADDTINKIYKQLKRRNIPFIYTNFETAELIKTATMGLATINMAFTNEIEKLCTSTGVDFDVLAKGVGLDKRIGKELVSSAGIGGSSLPRNSRVLINSARQWGIDLSILSSALTSNINRIKGIASKIIKYYNNNETKDNIKRVAILGLSFKGLTTNITESPSIFVIQELLDNGISVALYDPYYLPSSSNLNSIPNNIRSNQSFYVCDSIYDAVSQSDILVVMTNWPEFNSVNVPKIIELMQKKNSNKPVLFDCVNMFSQYDNEFNYVAA